METSVNVGTEVGTWYYIVMVPIQNNIIYNKFKRLNEINCLIKINYMTHNNLSGVCTFLLFINYYHTYYIVFQTILKNVFKK